MTKTKAETCIYNINRSCYKVALPWCNYLIELNRNGIKFPPNTVLSMPVTKETCRLCKCYNLSMQSYVNVIPTRVTLSNDCY
jgi:hypothetical protein